MKVLRHCGFFVIGGLGYIGTEILWRGWTHYSMFLAGGTAFLLLGELQRQQSSRLLKVLTGAGIITMVELGTGLLFNRSYAVWDYRHVPLNLWGQICLPYTLLWLPLGAGAMALYRRLDEKMP